MKVRDGNHLNPVPMLDRFLSNLAMLGSSASMKTRAGTMILLGIILSVFLLNVVLAKLINGKPSYQSSATLWGYPLLSCGGQAKGIIAIGGTAIGIVAIGGGAVGVVAIGGISIGLITIGGGAIGLLMAIGGGALGFYSLGGGAFGAHAYGGLAVGYYKSSGTENEILL